MDSVMKGLMGQCPLPPRILGLKPPLKSDDVYVCVCVTHSCNRKKINKLKTYVFIL